MRPRRSSPAPPAPWALRWTPYHGDRVPRHPRTRSGGGVGLLTRGKRYRAAIERMDRTRRYLPAEAVALLKETTGAKFDETVEAHFRLGLNVRHADQQLRGTLALP